MWHGVGDIRLEDVPSTVACGYRYIPHLVELVESGVVDPRQVLTQVEPMTDVLSAYRAFNERRPGWITVELKPAA